jgi:hypothetical protein
VNRDVVSCVALNEETPKRAPTAALVQQIDFLLVRDGPHAVGGARLHVANLRFESVLVNAASAAEKRGRIYEMLPSARVADDGGVGALFKESPGPRAVVEMRVRHDNPADVGGGGTFDVAKRTKEVGHSMARVVVHQRDGGAGGRR